MIAWSTAEIPARQWVAAVNAEGKVNPERGHGQWRYAMVRKVGDIPGVLAAVKQGFNWESIQ